MIETLSFLGALLHQTDKEGLTALCWACLKGHLHIIQSLLDRGSNLHHTDKSGRNPLQLAAFHGDAQVVSDFLTLNAPTTTKVVCFSGLLKCLRSLYGKQCGPRSGFESSQIFNLHIFTVEFLATC